MADADTDSVAHSKANQAENPLQTTPSMVESSSHMDAGQSKPNTVPHFGERLSIWVSIVTAVLSLVISIYTLVITTYEPELLLIMPNLIYPANVYQHWIE
jgi:hypothetical protein